jgi:xylulokinase
VCPYHYSDTAFGILSDPKPSASEGHIFCNPVDPEGSMAMVCYKNGSLTRQHFRDLHAGGSWDEFNALLQKAPIGTSPNPLTRAHSCPHVVRWR